MIQKVLTKYWLPVHIGALLFMPLVWLWNPLFTRPVPLLWLSLLAVEAFALLPCVRRGETLVDARDRVAKGVLWDPFFYVGLALVGFVLIQWLNSGRALKYLPDANLWRFAPPPVAWLPASVVAKDGFFNLCVWVAAIAGGVLLRQGVGRAAKRGLLQILGAVSGLLAMALVVRAMQGMGAAESLLRESAMSRSLGAFFGFWLVLGIGGVIEAQARGQRGAGVLYVFSFVGNLIGLVVFAPWPVFSAYGVAVLILSGYWLSYLRVYVDRAFQLKLFFITLIVFAIVALSSVYAFPGNPVFSKIKVWASPGSAFSKLNAAQELRIAAALKIWNDSPWTGVGPDGFRHFVGTVINDKKWALVKTDPSCVYNDAVQFLCEHGVLGFGFMIALVITLMIPLCYRARLLWLFGVSDESEGRGYLFKLSPFVVTGVTATTLCSLDSLIASPFRTPSLLLSWVFVMAMMPAFLPTKAQK